MKLDHICIITGNAEALIHWYKDNLGFEVLCQWTVEAMPGLELTYIGRDGFKIEIVGDLPGASGPQGHPLENIAPGYNHFALSVEDIAATLADLSAKGVTVAAPVMEVPQAGIKAAIVTDLDGNIIELVEPIG